MAKRKSKIPLTLQREKQKYVKAVKPPDYVIHVIQNMKYRSVFRDVDREKDVLPLIWNVFDEWPTRQPPDWSYRRLYVIMRASLKCERCNRGMFRADERPSSVAFNCHHKRALQDGGNHTLSNLVLLCERCHGKMPGHKSVASKLSNRRGIWTQVQIGRDFAAIHEFCEMYEYIEDIPQYKNQYGRPVSWIYTFVFHFGLVTGKDGTFKLNPQWRTILDEEIDKWEKSPPSRVFHLKGW